MSATDCNNKYKAPTAGGPKPPANTPASLNPTPTAPPTKPPVNTAACNSAKQAAQECCNKPETCVDMPSKKQGPAQNESIPAYCKRMQSAGYSDGSNKSNASETCQLRINSCNSNCGGSDASCNSLQSQVQTLAQMGLNSFGQSDWGRYCQELTNAQPQSASPGGGAPSPGGGSPTGGGDGVPTAAEQAAQKAIDAINNTPQGKSEFKLNPIDKGANGFNVADSGGLAAQNYTGNSGADSPLDKIKGGGQQGTIANNSGGQIPGGGGGGAKLGGGRGTGSPGSPGYTTDVLQGFQNGGGGGAAAGGGSTDPNGSAGEGFSGYGGGRGPNHVRDGMDLKKYLPGCQVVHQS